LIVNFKLIHGLNISYSKIYYEDRVGMGVSTENNLKLPKPGIVKKKKFGTQGNSLKP